MEMNITFPGGQKVNAEFEDKTVATDQNGSAPSPYSVFLASLGACAGFYVLRFLQSRNLPTDQVKLTQKNIFDPETGRLTDIRIDVQTTADFPAKYHKALVRAAGQCAVKKTLENPPRIQVYAGNGLDKIRKEAV